MKQKKLFKAIGIVIGIIVISIIGFIIYMRFFFEDSVPHFFPFDDPDATYTVQKEEFYSLRYNSTSDRNKSIDCGTDNGIRTCKEVITKDYTIIIGNSPVDLDPFIGKQLIVTGNFDSTKEQCIKGECKSLSSSWAVANIESIAIK